MNQELEISLEDRGGCPLCHHDSFRIHLSFGEIDVRRCDECDFLYSGQIMDSDALEKYYAGNFGSERHRHGQIVNAQVNYHALRRLLPVDSIESVLDVGTGYGYLPAMLRDSYETEVEGLEVSVEEAEHARSENGIQIHEQLLGDQPLSPSGYDLVSSFEVIEHLADPMQFLRNKAKNVKPGGWLVVCTDNFHSRVTRAMGIGFPKWIPHSHISLFSPNTLHHAVESLPDFNIKKVASFTPWELSVRRWQQTLRGGPPEFSLRDVLDTEMQQSYPLFGLRKLVNPHWFKLSVRSNLNGQLMFIAAQRSP